LLTALRDKEVLLILDSFEHLTGNAPLLLRLLTRAPHLKLLVTSRERLNMQGEQVVEVKGQPAPDARTVAASVPVGKPEEPWEAFRSYSAIRLFVHSAQRVRPDFDPATLSQEAQYALIQICQLLLGNPLAIELAATWVRALSCEEIAEKIAQDLSFLTAFLQNAPPSSAICTQFSIIPGNSFQKKRKRFSASWPPSRDRSTITLRPPWSTPRRTPCWRWSTNRSCSRPPQGAMPCTIFCTNTPPKNYIRIPMWRDVS
jgi:hypothetical protein